MYNTTTPTRGPHRNHLIKKIGKFIHENVGVEVRDSEGDRLLRAVAAHPDLDSREEIVTENLTTPVLGAMESI